VLIFRRVDRDLARLELQLGLAGHAPAAFGPKMAVANRSSGSRPKANNIAVRAKIFVGLALKPKPIQRGLGRSREPETVVGPTG